MSSLSGPQIGALFFLRDRTAHGGAYAGNMRWTKLETLRVLYRLKLISSDCGNVIQSGTFVTITQRGRDAIANAAVPMRYQ